MRKAGLIWLVFAVACSSATPPPRAAAPVTTGSSAPSVTPEELTAPRGHLTFTRLTLKQNGRAGLVMREDGTVEVPSERRVVGKLQRDGRFLDPNGQLVAELTEEGEVVTESGEYLPVTLNEDGTVKLLKENRVITLRDDGTLVGANPAAPVVTIEGVTEESRRAAMFLLVLSAYPVRSQP